MYMDFIQKLHVLDSLLSLFIFFPLNVIFWRGAWDIWGLYINPQPSYPSAQWILLAVSGLGYASFFVAPLLDRLLERSRTLSYFVATRLFLIVSASLHLCFWRALWETFDALLSRDWYVSAAQLLLSYGVLLFFCCARTCIFAPFYVAIDTRHDLLRVGTRFITKVSVAHENFATAIHLIRSSFASLLLLCFSHSRGGTGWTPCFVTSSSHLSSSARGAPSSLSTNSSSATIP